MAITHNIDSIIKKLNLIEKAYLPQAAEQALKSFGFESRKTFADAMRDKYQTATNYTLKSPRFEHHGSELRIYINDDQRQNQSAAEYLFPTDSSDGPRQKPIKPTTLAGFLQGKYGTNKIPVPEPGSSHDNSLGYKCVGVQPFGRGASCQDRRHHPAGCGTGVGTSRSHGSVAR